MIGSTSKAAKEQVLPCNCHHCGIWTATRYAHRNGAAHLTCTVCNETASMDMGAKDFRKFVKATEVFMRLTAATKEPKILSLAVAGNSLSLKDSEQ